MRKRLLVTGAAVVACAAALLPLQNGASAESGPVPLPAGSVTPDKDPFYQAPDNIGSYASGQIVSTRPVDAKSFGLKLDVTATQIAYRTNDSHLSPTLTVTTLVVPTSRWAGAGPRPVVSLQMPEDSAGLQCSPSYQFASGELYGGVYVTLATPLMLNGWAIAVPDFQGPKAEFMTGYVSGQAVLDGIRAVKSFNQYGIGTANPWALNGYSGGANATGWAAELQPKYAPEVKLVGTAMGGTPADPSAVARSIDGGAFSGFEATATDSFLKEYPEAGLDALINDKGRAALAQIDGKCLADILGAWAFKKLADYSTVPDPLAVPSVAAILRQNTIGVNGAPSPSNPIYSYHANTDEIVPVAQADTAVKAWCKRGAVIYKERDWLGEHALELVFKVGAVNSFLSDRFAGKKPQNNC